MAFAYTLDQMPEIADATGRNHRHRHSIRDDARQFEIIAIARSIPVHRGHQQFASAEFGKADSMRDRIDTGRLPTAVGEDFPAFADAPTATQRR